MSLVNNLSGADAMVTAEGNTEMLAIARAFSAQLPMIRLDYGPQIDHRIDIGIPGFCSERLGD